MSNQGQWLLGFIHQARCAGLPLTQAVAAAGVLRLKLALAIDEQGRPLSVTIQPKISPSVSGFATTPRFIVSYEGCNDLTTKDEETLNALVRLLAQMESSFPSDFSESLGVFDAATSKEERFIALYPFCRVERAYVDGKPSQEILIRTTPHCNQACPFCSAPPTKNVPEATLLRALNAAAKLFPDSDVTLTGGEPTLRPSFVAEVQYALALSNFARVVVQTNATRFARTIAPVNLPAHERLHFFVSLHALTPHTYDRITGTQHQMELACSGISRLLAAGHTLTLNAVICRHNVHELDTYVTTIAKRFASHDRLDLHFSTLLCPEGKACDDLLIPHQEAIVAMAKASSLAKDLGITMQSLRSSTYASPPVCIVPKELRGPSPRRLAQHVETLDLHAWVKGPNCHLCQEYDTCLGVTDVYAKSFGLDEFVPLTTNEFL